jgi:hypothetical protein
VFGHFLQMCHDWFLHNIFLTSQNIPTISIYSKRNL